jgi:hypothetical protein
MRGRFSESGTDFLGEIVPLLYGNAMEVCIRCASINSLLPPVAQLVRASSLYLEGPWFESKRVDTIPNASPYQPHALALRARCDERGAGRA